MKKLILIVFVSFAIQGFAQKNVSPKVMLASFNVSGVCGMCEERIEAALDVVGVKSAEWDKETQLIEISYNPKKIKVEDFHNLLSAAGHKTDLKEANKEAYSSLPGCCKYDDGVKKH